MLLHLASGGICHLLGEMGEEKLCAVNSYVICLVSRICFSSRTRDPLPQHTQTYCAHSVGDRAAREGELRGDLT